MRYRRVLSAYHDSYPIPDPAGNCVKSVVNVALDPFAWTVDRAYFVCRRCESIARVLLNEYRRIVIDYDTYYSINRDQSMQYEKVRHKREDNSSFSIRRLECLELDLVPNTGMICLQRLPLSPERLR